MTFKSDGDNGRLADKQANPCLLARLLVLAVSKQASKQEALFWAIKQTKEGFACLLTCLLVYYLYIVNLVVAVVSDRPLVILELISGGEGNANSENKPF